MRISASSTRHVSLLACCAATLALAACTGTSSTDGSATTSVPTSASVTVPEGQAARTPTGTVLGFGETATLPADAYNAGGALALYTVTGIKPGHDIPSDIAKDGDGYFIYVTVTSLATKAAPAPGTDGLAGSADGTTAALTLSPPDKVDDCVAAAPPETMKRGDSYATCLIAVADSGTELTSVIYWADTTGDPALDYKSAPVVWGTPAPASSTSQAPA